jgi:hypothetical protein
MLKAVQKIFHTLDQKLGTLGTSLEIKNPTLKKIFRVIFFIVALHLFYSYIGIYRFIQERPCSIHSSAQCQRASVALNYYQIDMNFFEPRILRYGGDDGVTGMEFPLVYYTAALLYKIFGFHDFYLRIISLIIISAGLVFFYLLTNLFIRNTILSSIIVSASILSPVLMYYSANFMPDAPSLGFTLIGWYFFFKFLRGSQKRDMNLFAVFAALGALIKAVSAMSFFIVIGLLVFDLIKKFKNESGENVFKERKVIITRVLIGMFSVFAWYFYARWLSGKGGGHAFAMAPRMIENSNDFDYVITYLKNWIYQYYSYETYVFLGAAILFSIVAFKKVNKFLLATTVLYGMAGMCYVYLFFFQFAHHDYYFIALMPFAFFLILTFTDGLMRLAPGYSRVIKVAFAIIIIFNIKECALNCQENYFFRFDSREYLGGDYRPYYDIEPKLRAIGITRKDKVVSAFDNSYCSSLYFMNQPGFTVEEVYQRDTIMKAMKAPSVKYLVTNDSAKFNHIYLKDLANKIVLTHRGLIVYKIR